METGNSGIKDDGIRIGRCVSISCTILIPYIDRLGAVPSKQCPCLRCCIRHPCCAGRGIATHIWETPFGSEAESVKLAEVEIDVGCTTVNCYRAGGRRGISRI
jgi:hypothetical protein